MIIQQNKATYVEPIEIENSDLQHLLPTENFEIKPIPVELSESSRRLPLLRTDPAELRQHIETTPLPTTFLLQILVQYLHS